jgi:HPt (histidine-containing phosphotransfer) domain-containing protein
MHELTDGLNRGDVKLVERAAHTLKSSSANIGAIGLSALCKEMEERARTQGCDAVKSLVGESSRVMSEVEGALKTIRA